jgi:acetylornithine deacetylase/succinyl-diaminopimelate desuccinylase-like protein
MSVVEEFVEKLRREDPELDIEIEVEIPSSGKRGFFTPEVGEDELFVKILKEATKDVLGFSPPSDVFPGGSSDASAIQRLTGIPTIPAFGPGILCLCHQPNEYVHVKDIIAAAKIYALAATRYLSM